MLSSTHFRLRRLLSLRNGCEKPRSACSSAGFPNAKRFNPTSSRQKKWPSRISSCNFGFQWRPTRSSECTRQNVPNRSDSCSPARPSRLPLRRFEMARRPNRLFASTSPHTTIQPGSDSLFASFPSEAAEHHAHFGYPRTLPTSVIWSSEGAISGFHSTHSRHRRRRLSRLASLRAAGRRRARRDLPRQLLHQPEDQRRAPARPAELRAGPARRHAADLAGGRRDLQPGLPRRARATISSTRSRR